VSASSFVIENILGVLGGGGAVVIGLSSFLGKVWSNRALLRERAKIDVQMQNMRDAHDRAMDLLEKDFQIEQLKRDQFHQISKKTYEEIFNKKISLYSELLAVKNDFGRFVGESAMSEVDDPTDELCSFYLKTKRIIEDNRMYVTGRLSEKYSFWYRKAAPYLKKAELAGYDADGRANDEFENEENIMAAQNPILSKMVFDTQHEMQEIFSQIDRDIDQIRTQIEEPLNKPFKPTGTALRTGGLT